MKLHDHMCAAGFLGKVKGNPENSCLIESYSPFCIAFFSGQSSLYILLIVALIFEVKIYDFIIYFNDSQ